jgi:hypothetical protein
MTQESILRSSSSGVFVLDVSRREGPRNLGGDQGGVVGGDQR